MYFYLLGFKRKANNYYFAFLERKSDIRWIMIKV